MNTKTPEMQVRADCVGAGALITLCVRFDTVMLSYTGLLLVSEAFLRPEGLSLGAGDGPAAHKSQMCHLQRQHTYQWMSH